MKTTYIMCSIFLMLLNVPIALQAKRMVYKKEVAPSSRLQLSCYGYTGQEKEGKLYNYRARMYDPKLRRFLSPDKAKQQHGAYTYVASNPVSLVDRNGKAFIFPEGDAGVQFKKVIEYLKTLSPKHKAKIEWLEDDILETISFKFIKDNPDGSMMHFRSGGDHHAHTLVFDGLVTAQLGKDGVYRMTNGVPKIVAHELLGHAYAYRYHEAKFIKRMQTERADGFDNDEEYHAIMKAENPSGVIMNEIHLKKNEAFIFNAPTPDHLYNLGFTYEVGEDWVSSMPQIGGSLTLKRTLTANEVSAYNKVGVKIKGEDVKLGKAYPIMYTVAAYEANKKGELLIRTEDDGIKESFKIAGQPIEELKCNK